MDSVDALSWSLAAAPIVLLLALVLIGRSGAMLNGLVTLSAAVGIGMVAFEAGPLVVAVGAAKGLWTGVWILCVVWAALLVFHLTREMGLMRLGDRLSSILPRDVQNVLIVAWILSSLIQGVAGFGVPIAVAAPLLVTMGISATRAVALPLVGYHWAVGFGSMGSSFYMGALTANLGPDGINTYATTAAGLLGISTILGGMLVCLLHSGWRGLRNGWSLVLVAGSAMAVVQTLVVQLEPAIGAVSGASAGLLTVGVFRLAAKRSRNTTARESAAVGAGSRRDATPAPTMDDPTPSPNRRDAGLILVPYVVLILAVLAVYVPQPSRTWVKGNLLAGPHLPATSTGLEHHNVAVGPYTPIALLGHPATYLVLAAVVSLLTWRCIGVWPSGQLRPVLRKWLRQAVKSATPVLTLATLAKVMTDTGMVRTIAVGAANTTGSAFPLVSPLLGALGSFTTGSTTSSNALFAGLQSEVAQLLDVPATTLLAAQLAGGNIGNIIAPMVIAIGVAGVSIRGHEGRIMRLVAVPTTILLLAVTLLTVLMSLRS